MYMKVLFEAVEKLFSTFGHEKKLPVEQQVVCRRMLVQARKACRDVDDIALQLGDVRAIRLEEIDRPLHGKSFLGDCAEEWLTAASQRDTPWSPASAPGRCD